MGRCIVLALIVITGTIASLPAYADDGTHAKELFEEGRELAKQGKWQEACTKFSESNRLDRAVGTALNLADCLVHVGKLADAWRLFDEGATELERAGNAPRAQVVRGRADDLVGKLATVVVKVAQPEAGELTVTIAGHDVSPKPEITQRLDPGTVVVTATAPGHEPFKTTVTIPAGGSVTIEVPALAAPRGDDTVPGPRRRSRVYLAYGLGAAGGVAIVSGILMNVIAQSRYDDVIHNISDCLPTTPPQCYPAGLQKVSDAQSLADIGTVTAIVGVVVGVGAGVVYFTAPRERVTVTPVATAHGVGLAIGGSF